jgi:hypothetical protein
MWIRRLSRTQASAFDPVFCTGVSSNCANGGSAPRSEVLNSVCAHPRALTGARGLRIGWVGLQIGVWLVYRLPRLGLVVCFERRLHRPCDLPKDSRGRKRPRAMAGHAQRRKKLKSRCCMRWAGVRILHVGVSATVAAAVCYIFCHGETRRCIGCTFDIHGPVHVQPSSQPSTLCI